MVAMTTAEVLAATAEIASVVAESAAAMAAAEVMRRSRSWLRFLRSWPRPPRTENAATVVAATVATATAEVIDSAYIIPVAPENVMWTLPLRAWSLRPKLRPPRPRSWPGLRWLMHGCGWHGRVCARNS